MSSVNPYVNCERSRRANKGDGASGFGLELTFRVTIEDSVPPTWPAEFLQSLARYVFQVTVFGACLLSILLLL